MAQLTDYLHQGYRDLKNAGCESGNCSGDGFAFVVRPSEEKILCGLHYEQYRKSHDDIEEQFTVEE